jgi:hypothetical protein
MPSLWLRLIPAAMALCLFSCAKLGIPGTQGKDYGALSAQLKKDMSEVDVSKMLGSAPDKADTVTCVNHDGSPWQCKTWLYYGGRPKNSLRLVLCQAEDKAWRVATWQIY